MKSQFIGTLIITNIGLQNYEYLLERPNDFTFIFPASCRPTIPWRQEAGKSTRGAGHLSHINTDGLLEIALSIGNG